MKYNHKKVVIHILLVLGKRIKPFFTTIWQSFIFASTICLYTKWLFPNYLPTQSIDYADD